MCSDTLNLQCIKVPLPTRIMPTDLNTVADILPLCRDSSSVRNQKRESTAASVEHSVQHSRENRACTDSAGMYVIQSCHLNPAINFCSRQLHHGHTTVHRQRMADDITRTRTA